MGSSRRIHAAVFSFMTGVMPPMPMLVTARRVSGYLGLWVLQSGLPKVGWPLWDRVYDADWFTEILKNKGIRTCIPKGKQRKKAVK